MGTGIETGEQVSEEVWKNNGETVIYVKKKGVDGTPRNQQIRGGDVLRITPLERAWNEENVRDAKYNVFRNGMLTPAQVVDPDLLAELAANPNFMTEEDMKDVVKGNAREFAKRLAEISSPQALQRLLEVAKVTDAPVKRYQAIEGRLEQVQATSKSIYSHRETSDKK